MKKILILWLGAFGFAIAKHLGENNPNINFYASEVNSEIFDALQWSRKHPFFFSGVQLPENIELVSDIHSLLPEVDIIIAVIPCQFITNAFSDMKPKLKPWVSIVNLSKWINNTTLKTTSETLADVLQWIDYNYAYLAWGMIAQELVDNTPLGADIVSENTDTLSALNQLFSSDKLHINLVHGNVKNTELYAALKNIIALILWYYQWQWQDASSQWYYLTQLLLEIQWVISLLKGNKMDFSQYALTGDIIATCFGGSRNRLLGQMLGQWTSIETALEELKKQNKIAEGYETLKGVYKITEKKGDFQLINSFWNKFLTK